MLDRAELDRSWVVLGQRLAASRRVVRLTQTALGGLIGCVRSTVSHIERARRRSDRTFWTLADQHCGADGVLLAAFDELQAAEADYCARCEVEQAQAELDRLTASHAPHRTIISYRSIWRPAGSEYSGGVDGTRCERRVGR